ncbi:MAG: DNA alkylation repair protein [Persicimonas sp.]
MTIDTAPIVQNVASMLAERADAEKAAKMAEYMKTEMPFYGVQAKPRDEIVRAVGRDIALDSREDYQALVLALWQQPHREENNIAIRLARRFSAFINFESLSLYERLIREGAWWDFVDEIAGHLVGRVLAKAPDKTWPVLDRWVEDDDMWIRRTALLAQKRQKDKTDQDRLFRYCLACADEDEFFIRKAIGWALREYSYVAPDAVRGFVDDHRDRFSGLTIREATKRLD